MVRSEEADVADSTELQGLCYSFCAQPQGTEGPREEKAWKTSEAERECPSAEAHMEVTRGDSLEQRIFPTLLSVNSVFLW